MRKLIAERGKLTLLTKRGLITFLAGCIICSGIDEGFAISEQVTNKNSKKEQGPSFSTQIKHFLNHLTKAPKEGCSQIFDQYDAIISKSLDLQKVYSVSYKEVESLLNQAAKESIDALTLFTHPALLEKNGSAIFFSEELLRRVNNNFDFHGLFNISANGAKNGNTVWMKFLVAGQGKFIVGYDRNEKIKHPDYNFATGNYDYNELFLMDAKRDSQGNPGLSNIKAFSNPAGTPRWMKGPLNVDIQSLTMTTDATGRRRILIKYDLFGSKYKTIDPIPIEKLTHQ